MSADGRSRTQWTPVLGNPPGGPHFLIVVRQGGRMTAECQSGRERRAGCWLRMQLAAHRVILVLLTTLIFGCAMGQAAEAPPAADSSSPESPAQALPAAVPGVIVQCLPPPITVPTAAAIPGLAELDPTTGLHYTGSGDVVEIDLEAYRFEIAGMVDYPMQLRYDDLRCLPKIERMTTIVCRGNFDDTAVWAGASLRYVLEMAGIQAQANTIRLVSADGYEAVISRQEAMSETAFLAYEWQQQPVPVIHGFLCGRRCRACPGPTGSSGW